MWELCFVLFCFEEERERIEVCRVSSRGMGRVGSFPVDRERRGRLPTLSQVADFRTVSSNLDWGVTTSFSQFVPCVGDTE